MSTRRNIRILALHNFLVDFSPYMPVAIIYFATITGSFALGMTVFSIAMVSSAIFEVPTGVLSDFVGRKQTFLLGSIAGTLSVVCYALGGSFWLLAVGSVLDGLAYSFYSGNNNAFLHETLREDGRIGEYAHLLGRTNALCQAGLGISAVLGSAVAFFFPIRSLFLIGVIPRIGCIVVSLLLREPKVHEKELTGNVFSHLKDALMEFKRNAKLRTLSFASIINFGVAEASYRFSPTFFATLWPVWAMGLARVISNITGFLGFWFAGPVIRRFKELKSLIVGKLFGSGISLFAMLFPTVLSPLLDSCASLTFGLQHTAENSLLQREFTHRQRATMGSLNQFAGSILFGIAAFVLGSIADWIGPTRALIIAECIILANVFLYWRLFRHEQRK